MQSADLEVSKLLNDSGGDVYAAYDLARLRYKLAARSSKAGWKGAAAKRLHEASYILQRDVREREDRARMELQAVADRYEFNRELVVQSIISLIDTAKPDEAENLRAAVDLISGGQPDAESLLEQAEKMLDEDGRSYFDKGNFSTAYRYLDDAEAISRVRRQIAA